MCLFDDFYPLLGERVRVVVGVLREVDIIVSVEVHLLGLDTAVFFEAEGGVKTKV